MKKRVYIDTSVVGGYFDEEFSADTIPFFDTIKSGGIIVIISDLLEAELLRAPKFVRELLKSLPISNVERISLSPEATLLADKYIEAKVVGKTSRADCQHIAIATICHADVLVSWNFKHIVNLDRIRGYNGINFQTGYHMIEIRTPKEIFSYGNED
jgi:predicted nucleic acid-binding protein